MDLRIFIEPQQGRPTTTSCGSPGPRRTPATTPFSARTTTSLGQEVADLNPFDLAGTVGQVVDQLGSWQSIGVTRFYLQLLDLSDIDQVELIAAEMAPQLA